MKKLFFVMAAVAALLTSCSKDDTFGGPTRGKVTFEVSTPELATRYGEGTTATNLQYAVYDMVEDATNGTLVKEGTTNLSGLKATVTIDLVEGREYSVIFWADAGANSPYVFNTAADQKSVSYKDGVTLTANNEAYDAFYAFVPQADIKVGQTVNVTLKRPFAQLNVATSDTEKDSSDDAYKALGVQVKTTGIEVDIYTSLNLATGTVDGERTLTFTPAVIEKGTMGEIEAAGKTYNQLSMNYLLVSEKKNIDVKFKFTDTNDKAYERSYTSVPVQRNHRTNILGSILTDPTAFDVEVKPGFETPNIDVYSYTVGTTNYSDLAGDAGAVAAAIAANKPLELVQNAWYDADVAGAITIGAKQTLTINLNGHTLCGDADGDLAYLFEIEDGGTLIINGAVITRGGASDTDGTISSSTGIFHVTGGTLEIYNAIIKSSNIPVHVKNTDEAAVTIKKSTLIGGSDDKVAFWVDNGANLDKLTLDIFGADNNVFEGDIKFGNGDDSYTVDNEGYYHVASWAEFTAALAKNMTKIKLSDNITYDKSYDLKKNVTIDLNGNTLEISDPTKRINIGNKNDTNAPKPNVTIKNGNLHSKVYAQTGNVELYDIKFGGTIAYAGDAQGVITVGSANLLAERCDMANVKADAPETRPRALSTEGCSNGYLILRDCNFPSASDGTGTFVKTKLLRTYINPLSGNAKLELTNCKFGVACNIDLAASYVWSNMDLNGCSGGFTFTIPRDKDSLTEEETAIMTAVKQNNSGTIKAYYNGTLVTY